MDLEVQDLIPRIALEIDTRELYVLAAMRLMQLGATFLKNEIAVHEVWQYAAFCIFPGPFEEFPEDFDDLKDKGTGYFLSIINDAEERLKNGARA